MPSLHLRPAVPEDAGELLSIYRPYVEHTAVTFEYAVPTPAQFTQRVRDTLATHPYLVAEAEGTLLGYAYAAPFHPRAAYQWAAETTIYLRQDQRGRGLGRRLYGALEALLTAQNVLNCNACIALPQVEDETLTLASLRFHQRLGYTPAGQFHQCGYKFGRWYHMVWMEKFLGPIPLPRPPSCPSPSWGSGPPACWPLGYGSRLVNQACKGAGAVWL